MNKSMEVILLVVGIFSLMFFCEGRVELTNNEYTGLVIAIEPTVPENPSLVDSIISMMTNASVALLAATQQRAYFKEVTILLPKTWTSSNYPGATTETYASADIRIAPPHPVLLNTPYAWTYTACGKGGEYIHLTPDYVTDDSVGDRYGPRGETVVHEWGHYRWGVFDEYPTEVDKQFYFNSTGGIEATRCSGALEGTLIDRITFGECTIVPTTRLPSPSCYFYDGGPQQSGLKTSMMYKQFLSQVTTFCHSNDSDPLNRHNVEAPNNQNKRCDQRSTWDVIMDSVDFQNGRVNTPNFLITDTTPQFKVIKAIPKRVVLVMDVSGSMRGAKIQSVAAGTEHLILNVINDGTHVGLVSFSSAASVLGYLSELSSSSSRTNLSRFIPTNADGGTGIGLGIQKGLEVLKAGGQSPNGGTLVVFTDGIENVRPYVAAVTPEVINAGVTVHTVFIGLTDVNQVSSLVDLSNKTGGTWGVIADVNQTGSQLNNVLASLSQNVDGDLANERVQISSRAVTVSANTKLQLSTAIDASVGNRTTFTFAWLNAQPKIEIKPPQQNCIFSNFDNDLSLPKCAGNDTHEVDAKFKSVIFTIPGTAEIGEWEYNISSSVSDTITIAVVSASSGEDPITVEVVLTNSNVNESETTTVIAKVFQKLLPVLGANVTAKAVRPTGSDFEMQLLDNGSGADLTKNDGVYSRYFTDFNSQGRYYFEVFVTKNGDDNDNGTITPPSGTFPINPADSNLGSETSGAKIKGVLERVASGPGLEYTGSTPTGDIFPPNKIIDLSVSQVNLDNPSDGVVLEFTSPGDDYDHGTASMYEVRYTLKDSSELRNDFAGQIPVDEDKVTNGNLSSPKPAMNAEAFTVSLADLIDDVDSIRVAFALRAFDEAGNPSEVSNIVVTRFFIKSPPPLPRIPEPDVTTTAAEETTTSITSEDTSTLSVTEVTEAVENSPDFNRFIVYIVIAVAGVILLIVIIVVAVRYSRKKKLEKMARTPEQVYSNISRV